MKDVSLLGQGLLVPEQSAVHQLSPPITETPVTLLPSFSVNIGLCGCLQQTGQGQAQQDCQFSFSLATLALHGEASRLMCDCSAHAIDNVLKLSYLSPHASVHGKLASWRPFGYGEQSPYP